MLSRRMSRRLLRHHLPIGAITLASAAVLYVTRPYPDVITRLSFASAYPALILIAATLLVGPFKILTGAGPAVSLDLRRDIGIWAGLTGLFHAVAGQFVHLRGRPWLYYIYENWQEKHFMPVRYDRFGLANYTGLVATLVLLALLATSNDAFLRKMGTPGWKRLQRWNYAAFGLTAIHTFAYQWGPSTLNVPFATTAIVAVAITLLLQVLGYRRRSAM